MAKEETVAPLNETIQRTLEFKTDELVTRNDWGSINFEDAREDLDRIFAIIKHLDILPLEYLTDQAVKQIHQALNQVNEVLKNLNNFSLDQGTPVQIRDQLVHEIHNQADNFYTIATPWIPFLAYQKGDVAQNISVLTSSVREANDLVESAKSDIESKHNEINEIVVKAREASASAGAAVFTKDFDGESSTLKSSAENWLIVTAVLALATIGFAVLLWWISEPTDSPWQAAQKFGARIIILVVLFTATLWCGRIYKALMHQAVTNRHRALSLQTFQAFSAAASDDDTRNAVLTETTRSIFASSASGYIDSEAGSESPLKIIEISRAISGGSESS
ncbi:hypothetical protein [Pseudidiomarina terrestris]|uniref:hypothetical protein n=1 Tax=Pseudidiomarina terrestris TaxID=2820060 RepID=UPI00264DEF85|nr:hypothetical protein [Pseudidiomarina sp. 1ASP75-5]MDN7134915.1 hypothetical protein [Pseudidiomarina sp. 1ASP75-5]